MCIFRKIEEQKMFKYMNKKSLVKIKWVWIRRNGVWRGIFEHKGFNSLSIYVQGKLVENCFRGVQLSFRGGIGGAAIPAELIFWSEVDAHLVGSGESWLYSKAGFSAPKSELRTGGQGTSTACNGGGVESSTSFTYKSLMAEDGGGAPVRSTGIGGRGLFASSSLLKKGLKLLFIWRLSPSILIESNRHSISNVTSTKWTCRRRTVVFHLPLRNAVRADQMITRFYSYVLVPVKAHFAKIECRSHVKVNLDAFFGHFDIFRLCFVKIFRQIWVIKSTFGLCIIPVSFAIDKDLH